VGLIVRLLALEPASRGPDDIGGCGREVRQLRTPLTPLRLRLENLERDVVPAGRRELDAALTELDRLGLLVDGLLALSRATAGAAHAEQLDLEQLVRERVDAWSALAQERGLTLVAETHTAVSARAAPERVRQVLDNLVENAVEVSPAGGTVTVAARAAPPWAELRVSDEGPGLDAEGLRRAFDRFWRGRGGEGSGLGLAIVRQLVEADGDRSSLRRCPVEASKRSCGCDRPKSRQADVSAISSVSKDRSPDMLDSLELRCKSCHVEERAGNRARLHDQ
jgi:signal transduction histidine kinase